MKKLTLIFLTVFLCFNTSFASHFSGGEIRYEHNGTNYDIYISLFKLCEGGVDLRDTIFVKFKNSSTGVSFTDTAYVSHYDTVNINCATTQSRCRSVTATIPGFITGYYKISNKLLGQGEWEISTDNSARIGSMANIVGGTDMHLYTTLNNWFSINSNALMANSPSYYMTTGASIVLPLQSVDPEGDSLVYEMTTPLINSSVLATYKPGHSLVAPFGIGGVCNLSGNTLTLKSNNQGNYALAFKVKEYRNGTKVSEFIREFTVSVLPNSGGNALTMPAPPANTNYNYITCSGQSNNISISFTDPTITDSVYIDIDTPIVPGWNFTTTITNGKPTANASISWITPNSLNPATMPHFYIKIRARDNACPRSISDYAIAVRTKQCFSDSVWAGDANGDFTVNILDPLAIAIANGKTGPTRAGATTNWVAQYAVDWNDTFVTNSMNVKHADCNGDGTINNADLAAVTLNYNKSHPKRPRNKTTGSEDLFFDLTGITLKPDSLYSIPMKYGTPSQVISDVYGIATKVSVENVALADAPTISTVGNSWINNTANAINFVQPISNNVVDWAHARIDQNTVNGNGTIGLLNFKIPSTAKHGDTVYFKFLNSVKVDELGKVTLDFNERDTFAIIEDTIVNVTEIQTDLRYVSIIPNPSGNTAELSLSLPKKATVRIGIKDISGRHVIGMEKLLNKGMNRVQLPASELSQGMYLVHLKLDGLPTRTLKWIKR